MKTLILIVALFLTLSTPTLAYIDPGSGSAIMSAIIGFFVAIGFAIKTYWYKIKGFFGRKPAHSVEENSEKKHSAKG